MTIETVFNIGDKITVTRNGKLCVVKIEDIGITVTEPGRTIRYGYRLDGQWSQSSEEHILKQKKQ